VILLGVLALFRRRWVTGLMPFAFRVRRLFLLVVSQDTLATRVLTYGLLWKLDDPRVLDHNDERMLSMRLPGSLHEMALVAAFLPLVAHRKLVSIRIRADPA